MSNRTSLSSFQCAIANWVRNTILSWATCHWNHFFSWWHIKVAETKLLNESSAPDQLLPNVDEFFNVFKHKIKYNVIGDFNLVTFLKGKNVRTFSFYRLCFPNLVHYTYRILPKVWVPIRGPQKLESFWPTLCLLRSDAFLLRQTVGSCFSSSLFSSWDIWSRNYL